MDASGLNPYGFERYMERVGLPAGLDLSRVARVSAEHRARLELLSASGPLVGVVRRGDRYRAADPATLPKVGDWVTFEVAAGGTTVAVERVLPRVSRLARVGVGKEQQEQIVAANVDLVLVVLPLDVGWHVSRLERYLVMVAASGAAPVVVLTKDDVVNSSAREVEEAARVSAGAPVLAINAKSASGVAAVQNLLPPGLTAAVVGPSGAGKSTLVNGLLAAAHHATGAVREDGRGRHTTTHRELTLLPTGALLVDTPGIRELQLAADETALASTFADIEALSGRCRFHDCDHEKSEGCAVLAALATGELGAARYQSYLKLKREMAFTASKSKKRVHEGRQRKFKQQTKEMHRRIKSKREW